MAHHTIYDRSPFMAGILSVFDLFGQAYQRTPAYPHASELDALREDWQRILLDGSRAFTRARNALEEGSLPTQPRLAGLGDE